MTIFANNRRASYDYQLHDTFVAGLVLNGHEVKSIKAGRANLTGSYIRLRANEAWLINAYIAPYQTNGIDQERRDRKLLLSRRELNKIAGNTQSKLQIIPLDLHSQRGFIKLKFATASSRRKVDKRVVLRAREAERDIKRRS